MTERTSRADTRGRRSGATPATGHQTGRVLTRAAFGATALVTLAAGAVLVGPASTATADRVATAGQLPAFVYDAHRGGGLEVRENSLSGLAATLDSATASVLDLDTQQLGDGTLVLLHDNTVDRATTSTGSTDGYTAATWKDLRLDLGSWLPAPPEPEQPATLEEALDRFGGHTVMTVEAKDADSVDRLAEMVATRGLAQSVYVNTNDPEVARHVHELGLLCHLWRSPRQMATDDPRAFADFVDLVDLDIRADDADFGKYVGVGHWRVWAHTLTTREERDRALRLGADGIITDDPRYVSGATDTFPAAPTTVRLTHRPRAVQVSDPTSLTVVLGMESGPTNPDARAGVTGRGVSATTISTGDGVNRLQLDTTRAAAGTAPVTVEVPSGSAAERRWLAGSLQVPLALAPEDLQLRPTAVVRRRRVTVAVRVLDSGAAAYTGPRHELVQPTVAGLERARLTLQLLRGRTVVASTKPRRPVDPDRDGDAEVTTRMTAPGPGRYTVRVVQHGATYADVTATRGVTVS